MNERDILSGIVNTLVEKPKYKFTIEVTEQIKLHKWRVLDWILKKWTGFKPETEREIVIRPCKVVNLHRVAGQAILLPNEIIQGDLSEAIMPLLVPHREGIVYMIASAIQNNIDEPSEHLINFITSNFDNIDIFNGMYASLNGLEMQSFMNTIVLARGTLGVLKPKASPMDGSELIASLTAQ